MPTSCGVSPANWNTRSSRWTTFPRPRSSAGCRGQVRVVLDTQRLAAYGLTPGAVVAQLGPRTRAAGRKLRPRQPGVPGRSGQLLYARGRTATSRRGSSRGRPVYLRDVVEKIEDGPAEPDRLRLVRQRAEAAQRRSASSEYPAVTITLAKRKGTNATHHCREASAQDRCAARLHCCPTI